MNNFLCDQRCFSPSIGHLAFVDFTFGSPVAVWLVLAAVALGLLAFGLYRREMRMANHLSATSTWLLPTLRGLAVCLIVLTLAEPTIETRNQFGDPSRLVFLLDGSRSMTVRQLPDANGRTGESPNEISLRMDSLVTTGQSDNPHRFDRAAQQLVSDGFLEFFKSQFNISLARIDNGQQVSQLWSSDFNDDAYFGRSSPPPTIDQLRPANFGDSTPLGSALRQSLIDLPSVAMSALKNDTASKPVASVVLFSDGRSNLGPSPLSLAAEFKRLGVAIFPIGMAPYREPADVGLGAAIAPTRLYRDDVLRGNLQVLQNDIAGRDFTIQIEYVNEVLWQEKYTATDEAERSIDFALPVETILSLAEDASRARAEADVRQATEITAMPVKLTARVMLQAEDGQASHEVNPHNNAADIFFVIAVERSRVLLLDGRPRWESRYLKNLFERDPAWELDAILQANYPSKDTSTERLPRAKDELFKYDLVVLGEVDPNELGAEFIGWLGDFVEQAGGGLVLIDGERKTLRDPGYAALHELLPIRWTSLGSRNEANARGALPKQVRLTAAGRQLDALDLQPSKAAQHIHSETSEAIPASATAADEIWAGLPPLRFVSPVEALPGSEVLLEAYNPVERLPLFVWRRYGAGRVLFFAGDETWRWRYRVADAIHSRFWLQLSRWIMKAPLSLHGKFVSLDTGAAGVPEGQAIEIRCRLRSPDGAPAAGRRVSAIVTSIRPPKNSAVESSTAGTLNPNGSSYAGGLNSGLASSEYEPVGRLLTVPMVEQSVPGSYVGQAAGLPPGDYEVKIAAEGFSSQALDVKSNFSVFDSSSDEMRRIACDEDLLKTLAAETGGTYLREHETDSLQGMLQSRSAARAVVSTKLLWESTTWFALAISLLTVEWIVRKVTGLA